MKKNTCELINQLSPEFLDAYHSVMRYSAIAFVDTITETASSYELAASFLAAQQRGESVYEITNHDLRSFALDFWRKRCRGAWIISIMESVFPLSLWLLITCLAGLKNVGIHGQLDVFDFTFIGCLYLTIITAVQLVKHIRAIKGNLTDSKAYDRMLVLFVCALFVLAYIFIIFTNITLFVSLKKLLFISVPCFAVSGTTMLAWRIHSDKRARKPIAEHIK